MNSKRLSIAVLAGIVSFAAAAAARAETTKVNKGVVLGNPSAPKGGTFLMNLQAEPATLNPITGTDMYNFKIQDLVMDALMERNPDTYQFDPALAEKVDISKDGREFTFTLRKGATFSDGKPVTAEDVKFSFDVIFDPKYNAAVKIPYYENIEKAEITGPDTVKFTAKAKFYANFEVLASMAIVPKHFYGNAEEGVKKNKTILGSGPYVLKEYNQGQSIVLERNKNWWGNAAPERRGQHNFQTIRMRFDKEENLALERLKKGELDFDALSPDAYVKKTEGAPWGTTVLKKKVENLEPKAYGYIGWNLRLDMFGDKRVRKALTHLMNREEMNQKFRYGMSLLARGPWYQQSEYADPNVKPLLFDPKKAAALLKEAGWSDTNKDGVLDKGGKPFEFTLTYGGGDVQKYFVLYQEDLKKAGIKMNLQVLEWNAMLKNVNEGKFEAIAMAWGAGSVDFNPKQVWHSSSAKPGGSNRTGYSNPEVDKLIEQGVAETDKKKRIPIYRKIYAAIAEDAPYTFMFNNKYALYAVNKRIGLPNDTFKYRIGTDMWWTGKE